ncbi:MAG: UDP-3-O-(3-hydroxymyristoyl)glucosamine N-acyltransferase [Flavobacteriales bacterium]|nr:MAG: UDP-3-O-(3-hydroxymyristoyl)glucosamine N-acyltransferase [Flavobacteriales bacterium]
MKFSRPYTIKEIAELIGSAFIGDPSLEVTGLNEIHRVVSGDIVFSDHPKYYRKSLESEATVVLINNKDVDIPEGKGVIVCDEPFTAFNQLIEHFSPLRLPTSMIGSQARVGEGTTIYPGAFLADDVVIGKDCRIYPGVVILAGTRIGDRVIIQPNAVIGSLGFYYKKREERFERLLSGGGVRIEDDVEIGSACTIDRGVTDYTIIGRGTVIDNQVQIGHDTQIGKKCLFASQVGIAGCVNIGDEVTLWGQVGVTSGITIGDKAVVLAQSGISKSLAGGKTYFGYPAEEARKKYREMASIRVLPEIIEHLQLDM